MTEVEWHAEMLADGRRVRGLAAAVRGAVRAGDVVLDLGTGSGLLAMVACQAGARRVYAVDRGDILEVARDAIRHNGFADRVTCLAGVAADLELPEPVDVVVAEVIGAFGLEEGILPSLNDARRRFLRRGGRLVPDALELWVAPTAQQPHTAGWHEALRADLGLDFAPLLALTVHLRTTLDADPGRFLAAPQRLLACDLTQATPERTAGRVTHRLESGGALAGFAGWFTAWAQGQEVLSTRPPNRCRSWPNAFFATGDPIPVAAGAQVQLSMRLGGPLWTWRLRVDSPAVERELGDLFSAPPGAFLKHPVAPRPPTWPPPAAS